MHLHPQSPHSTARRADSRGGFNQLRPLLARSLAVGGLLAGLTGCVVSDGPNRVVYDAPPPSGGDEVIYRTPDEPVGDVVITDDSDFYSPLEPYGQWVEVDGYGRCWQPRNVDRDWRPYTNGQWRRTDSGWYWESDESWGWATSHYGRWNQDSRHGWYWVPGTQWAPAWVSWREGGGYTGWAPLPPRRRSGVTVEVDVAPQAFVYVEERHFSERVRPTTVIVNNTTIINKTVNINQTRITNNTVINGGPRTEVIERATGRKVNVTPVHEVRQIDEKKVVVKPTPRQNPAARQDKTTPPTSNRDRRETRPPQTPPPQAPAAQNHNQPPPPPAGSPAGRQVVPPPQPAAPVPEHRERERDRDKGAIPPPPPPATNEKRETPVQPITGPRGSQPPNVTQPKTENGGPATVQKENAPKPTPPPPKPVKDLKKKPPVEKAPPPPKDKPDEPREKDKQQPQ